MRLRSALLACLVALPALAAPPAGSDMRSRADALRKQGDYEAALAAYESEMAIEGETADGWKHIGWTQKALGQFSDAATSLRRATELDPSDREAQDDLESLRLSRGLRLDAHLGGTEPGTSKNAIEGELIYGGLNRVELHAGGGWSDNIFYDSVKGYANAYWLYTPGSYAKADFTIRRYDYTGANRPTPDSNAYDLVPRAEVEVSHWFAERIRTAIDYQLFAPNFFFDPATRILNHKLTAELEARLGGGFSAAVTAALLRDPDPAATLILGRPVPGAPAGTVCSSPGQTNCAAATSVVFRTEFLLGGGLSYEASHWGASMKFIPNRDLDSSFAWSILSSLDLRPLDRLSFNFQWVYDRYSDAAGPSFAGQSGNIWWGTARYQFTRPLALGAGIKWVTNPSPADVTGTATRNGPTLLLDLEYRAVLF
jgi:tetratricopeptide (TPR) repeat protein